MFISHNVKSILNKSLEGQGLLIHAKSGEVFDESEQSILTNLLMNRIQLGGMRCVCYEQINNDKKILFYKFYYL